jgi:hypothetical protein
MDGRMNGRTDGWTAGHGQRATCCTSSGHGQRGRPLHVAGGGHLLYVTWTRTAGAATSRRRGRPPVVRHLVDAGRLQAQHRRVEERLRAPEALVADVDHLPTRAHPRAETQTHTSTSGPWKRSLPMSNLSTHAQNFAHASNSGHARHAHGRYIPHAQGRWRTIASPMLCVKSIGDTLHVEYQ